MRRCCGGSAFDPLGVLRAEEEGKGSACGAQCLALLCWAAKDLGADTVKVMKYATSGDVTEILSA
jgi:AmmeMemoRadiSam system protein B